MLLGGRIGDYMGRKRSFLIGLLGFAGASLLGGFAQNQQWLFGARALQGLFGALLAPAALSLISVTFTDSKERAKAFAVYGALSGVGGAIGLIAGGLLTQYLSWRWCLFVNTPMAIIAFSLAVPNVRESKVEGHPHYDVPGALTATAGMLSVVFGVSQASTDGWGSTSAWPYLVLGAFLLLVFFVIERRIKEPLLPLRLITDRVRAGAFLAQLFVGTRTLRDVPLHDLLLPVRRAVLGREDRSAVHAVLLRHHPRGGHDQSVAAEVRTSPAGDHRQPDGGRSDFSTSPSSRSTARTSRASCRP